MFIRSSNSEKNWDTVVIFFIKQRTECTSCRNRAGKNKKN